MKNLLALLAAPFLAAWSGFVLTKLWAWFVVSTFALPPLNLPQAVGLSIVAGFMTYQLPANSRNDEYLTDSIAWCAAFPLVALISGWVVKCFL